MGFHPVCVPPLSGKNKNDESNTADKPKLDFIVDEGNGRLIPFREDTAVAVAKTSDS